MWTMTPRGRLDLLRTFGPACLLIAFVQAGCMYLGIRFNATASLPIGLYVKSSNPTADLVEFCPPAQAASLALSRGYRSAGTCSDGGEPLLKPVIAKPGDSVTISQNGITINSKLLPNSRPKTQDSLGRVLTPWPFGVYLVADDTIWVISTFNAKSFDSRYFGPIELRSVRARLAPLLTE